MIAAARLLSDLQRLLKLLEDDVRRRVEENPPIDARLREQYVKAKAANRTAQAYEVWRDEYITQVAVAWILACVFVRFLEDNGLIEAAWLSGPGSRLQLARDQHTVYFQRHPSHSDREYLQHVFAEVASLPSMRDLLDGEHNPLTKLGPSGDGAHVLLEFWQKIEPATGMLIHDFVDPEWNTRFLGDLYQDLSESARDHYALLQTPEFVEEFILERTLDPAIQEFGYANVKMIDPACGSGHFLLGGFRKLLELRLRHEPAITIRAHVQSVLNQLYGVDVNPFAVAIARFRLLVAALNACEINNISHAPGFQINLAAGDSLLHGPRIGGEMDRNAYLSGLDPLQHIYETEYAEELRRFLGQQYHVVVANPPYIIVRDTALNAEYRKRFSSCYQKFSLVVPFMERCFHLALNPNGYVGMIAANSFMKREFGKKLVEKFIPAWDLTHVIDTAGAYIPGHGTPTVILFGRNRKPVLPTIRTVMGIRGEPATPDDPSKGLVWTAIRKQLDQPGSVSRFVNVVDIPRESFHKHPWSIGGGGAAELKVAIDQASVITLGDIASSIGYASFPGLDDPFVVDTMTLRRRGIHENFIRQYVNGEAVRNWSTNSESAALAPYGKDFTLVGWKPSEPWARHLWPYRTSLGNVLSFGNKTRTQLGDSWWGWYRWIKHKYESSPYIVFSNVATHNHFALDRGGKVFNGHAPLIILKDRSNSDSQFALLGLLNSSIGCFWMKQVFYPKGGDHVGTEGARIRRTFWDERFDFDGTKLSKFPISRNSSASRSKALDGLASQLQANLPLTLVSNGTPTREVLAEAQSRTKVVREEMISLQEELDWECYASYGLLSGNSVPQREPAPPLRQGERAFEIVMARKMAAGELDTAWFDRHNSAPITEIPKCWPKEYQTKVEQRIALIKSNPQIALIEQPEYKRRWSFQPWEEQQRYALRNWLLDRMEKAHCWSVPEIRSCAVLADCLRDDADFQKAAQLYRERQDFDWTALIVELVESESAPLLQVLRYADEGLRKRSIWERTWELQRREDCIDAEVRADASIPDNIKAEIAKKRKADEIGDIATPPKYESKDFRKSRYWSLRGKLDIPKERFVSFPFCERDVDPTQVIAWAGWSHLQMAQAIAAYYERVKNNEGWTPERRMPLLAGLLEIIPWLKQWHNDIHPEFRERMGDFFEQFVQDEARAMEVTVDQIRVWAPPAQASRVGRRRSS